MGSASGEGGPMGPDKLSFRASPSATGPHNEAVCSMASRIAVKATPIADEAASAAIEASPPCHASAWLFYGMEKHNQQGLHGMLDHAGEEGSEAMTKPLAQEVLKAVR